MNDRCAETAGFLFKHACRYPPTQQCAQCQRSICQRHAHFLETDVYCTGCARTHVRQAHRSGERTQLDDDPYFYGMSHYRGFGRYRPGHWGAATYAASRREDFTEADAASLADAEDATWEQDMGAS